MNICDIMKAWDHLGYMQKRENISNNPAENAKLMQVQKLRMVNGNVEE
jgi:hypothetical protein